MRVWALASCGGLLALTACSAEQSSSPDLGAAPTGGNDAAEVNAHSGLRATASSPMARPELRPQQGAPNRARFSPRAGRPAPRAGGANSPNQTLPQASQLRERLQRLRAQQGARLSPSTSTVPAPQPAVLTSSTPAPVAVNFTEVLATPGEAVPAVTNPDSKASFSVPAPVVTALPTPFRPTARSNVAAPETGSGAISSPPTNLGPIAAADLARNYPIVPLRHQGYSARPQQPVPTIATAAIVSPERLTLSAPRLHGPRPTSQGNDPAASVVTARPSLTPAPILATAPLRADSPGVRSVPEAATHDSVVRLGSAGNLTLTPRGAVAPSEAASTHQGQGIAARPATAIALPESMPLHQETPRLSPLRPVVAPSPAASIQAEAWLPEDPTPEVQVSEAQASEAQAPEIQASEAQAPIYEGGVNPKSLPAAYCLQASGLSLTPDALAAPSQGDLALGLSKVDPAAASCPEEAESAAAPADMAPTDMAPAGGDAFTPALTGD